MLELAAMVWLFGWPGAIAIGALIFFVVCAAGSRTPYYPPPPDPKEVAARLAREDARSERRVRRQARFARIEWWGRLVCMSVWGGFGIFVAGMLLLVAAISVAKMVPVALNVIA